MIQQKHQKFYFYSLFFGEFARTLPHAVLTVILVNKGVSLAQVAFIQMFYMIAVIMIELPSGFVSDLYNRKMVYMSSIIVAMIAYTIIFITTSLAMLALAWFIYGASSALHSGTLDVSFTQLYQKDAQQLRKFIAQMRIILSAGAMIGGYIGGELFKHIETKLYIVSLILYFIAFMITIIGIPSQQSTNKISHHHESVRQFKKNLLTILHSKNLLFLFILIGLIQLFLQPFYLYWQVIFLDNHGRISLLGLVYILFRTANILGSWVFKHIEQKISTMIFLLLCMIGLIITLFMKTNMYSIIIQLMTMIIITTIYNNQLEYSLRTSVNPDVLGTISSISNTISRLFSIITLFIASLFMKIITIQITLFLLTSTFAVISCIILIMVYLQDKQYLFNTLTPHTNNQE
ncbi:MFS transporter (plasmid) [Entomospira entomophila]|uniref:MFS transporter n=1 Tax=Entomospira entomophila TaxID=2719988 RepID=A0A968GD36_9SPIO|nr:MFS transporter [Entomospira entomophilus]NIZ41378.1 MFS transporter [Entomospira entomophilus]WDI36211.1 MFS transporter [Entomospira entomophilus]